MPLRIRHRPPRITRGPYSPRRPAIHRPRRAHPYYSSEPFGEPFDQEQNDPWLFFDDATGFEDA